MNDLHQWARRHSLFRFIHLDWKAAAPNILREIVIESAADETAARNLINDCLRDLIHQKS